MADNTVNVNVKVDSNLKQVKQEVNAVSASLKDMGETSTRTTAAMQTAEKATAAMARRTSSVDSGLSRGIGGQTGAEARDFAKQAQSLGGLVHVYATFAANIFAISAAFSALSKAADTSNMIKGLDQLGAASGRGLGSLAKQLAETTDGAISLRDAMSATALASSGGMASSAILRMGNVAKQASQALGISMPDAISRLSKGIVKLEPELLDELGIMVRVDTASQNYARSLGKSVSALTDFEKRQGFANEVLKQGEEKFSNIKIDANPYAKISASMENLAQKGLELVNTVLTPVLSILGSSPTALSLVVASFAGMLLKQAIPAIGAFRENAKAMADEAATLANKRSIDAKQATFRQITDTRKMVEAAAEEEFAAADVHIKKLEALKAASTMGKGTKARGIIDKSVIEVTDEEIKYLEKRGKMLEKNHPPAAQNYKDIAESIKLSRDYEIVIRGLMKQEEEAQAKKNTYFSNAAQQQRIADKANQEYTQRRIASMWAENTQTEGFFKATKQGWADLAEARKKSTREIVTKGADGKDITTVVDVKGINKFQEITAGVAGTAKSAVSSLANLANSLSNVFVVVGIAAASFELLDTMISKNAEQATATAKALTSLHDAAKAADSTLNDLSKRDPLYNLSANAINARATAFREVTDAADTAFNKIKEQSDAANFWDSQIVDSVKNLFGGGLLKNSAAELADSISKAFKVARPGSDTAKALQEIRSLLNIKEVDKKSLYEALVASPEKFMQVSPLVIASMKELSTSLSSVASKSRELDDTFKNASKVYDDVLTSLAPTDNLAKLGFQMINLGASMTEAFKDPLVALNKLAEISSDPSKLRFLSPEMSKDLLSNSTAIKNQVLVVSSYATVLDDTNAKIAEVGERIAAVTALGGSKGGKNSQALANLKDEAARLQVQKAAVTGVKEEFEKGLASTIQKLVQEEDKVFQRGAELISTSIGQGFEKAGITIAKAYATLLGGTTGAIDANARLDKANIDIQIKQIQASMNLALAMEELRLVEEERLIEEKKAALTAKGTDYRTARGAEAADLRNRELALAERKSLGLGGNSLKDVRNLLSSSSDFERQAGKGALGIATQTEAGKANIAQLAAQQMAIDVAAEQKTRQVILEQQKQVVGLRLVDLNYMRAGLDVISKNAVYENEALVVAKQINNEKVLQVQRDQEDLIYRNKLLDISKAEASGTQKASEIQKAKDDLNLERQVQLANRRGVDQVTAINNIEALSQAQKAAADYQINLQKITNDINNQNATNRLAISDEELSRLKNSGLLYQEDIARRTTALEISKEEARSLQALATLEADKAQKAIEFDARKRGASGDLDALAAIVKFGNAEEARFNTAIDNEKRLTESKKATLGVVGETAARLAEQNRTMELMNSAATSLTVIFGEMGTSLGNVATAMLKSADAQANINKELEKQREALKNDPTKDAKTNEINAKTLADIEIKAAKDSARAELEGYAATAGASKKLFSEKTAAYKILSNIEKAMHIAKLAMDVKEMLTNSTLIGARITGAWTAAENEILLAQAVAGAQITASTPAIMAKFFETMGPWGWAAGAAAIAAIGGTFSGSGASAPAGFTAEEQQKVQGTGQSYAGGKLVDNGGGALGDPLARSKAVQNSIDTLTKVNYEMLDLNRGKMLDALEAIKDNTYKFAKAIGVSTGIIGSTSAFGTTEGGSKGVLGGLWGASSTTIADKGIQVFGKLADLIQGSGTRQQYENVQSNSSSLFGLISNSNSSTNVAALSPIANKYLTALFTSFKEAISNPDTTALMGVGKDIVDNILESTTISIKTSSKGLTGAEFADAVMAEVGIQLDIAAKQAFPRLEELSGAYQHLGESSYEFLTRLTSDDKQIKLAFRSIGISFNKLPETVSVASKDLLDAQAAAQKKFDDARAAAASKAVEVTVGGENQYVVTQNIIDPKAVEAMYAASEELSAANLRVANAMQGTTANTIIQEQELIKAAGGLDVYISKLDKFSSAFLTEAERLAPVQQTVTETLRKLGYSTSMTRDEFKNLILSFDPLNASTRDTYLELLNLAPAFDLVAKATEAAKTKTYDLVTGVLQATGQSYAVLQRTREKELAGLSLLDWSLQMTIYAFEDLAKTTGLRIQILELEGRTAEATAMKRQQELLALSASDQALQQRIWALQDEAKFIDARDAQQVKILNLLGNSSAALAITREKELSAIDDRLKPGQLYLYALEDEASLKAKLISSYEKESAAIKTTISALKDNLKTLKEYKDSLLVGDASTKTPAERYAEAKRQVEAIRQVAQSTGTTEAEVAARNAAISKLPSVTDTFLSASRDLYASSEQYTKDFTSVLGLLDETSAALAGQQSIAEQQLSSLQDNTTILDIIKDNTASTTDLLAQYLEAVANTASASNYTNGSMAMPKYIADNPDVAAAYKKDTIGFSPSQYAAVHYAMYGKAQGKSAEGIVADTAGIAKLTNTSRQSIIDYAIANGIPYYAAGGVAKGLSVVGEKGPELVDFRQQARVFSNNASNDVFNNSELIAEIKKLREEVSQLRAEQKEQTGHLINSNYDANLRAASEITNATDNASKTNLWIQRSQAKVA